MIQLNPKARFLTHQPAVAEHNDLVARPAVIASLETALAEYTTRLPQASAPSQAWDNACRLQGARDFIHTWLNLGTEPTKPTRLQTNLETELR